ncbi:hypothetical protein HMPREF3039_00936 [Akkermansia sp. KLE1798]|nr:hypothetical protein HMPREF3039_00936 [Akkermansia sp. KLE1798]
MPSIFSPVPFLSSGQKNSVPSEKSSLKYIRHESSVIIKRIIT